MLSAIQQIRVYTTLAPIPFVPEILLHQATDEVAQAWVDCSIEPTPYWAFPWPGGQAVARFILDNPEWVRGKRVLDFASGSGLIGIAAMKAGAAKVYAYDIDRVAKAATQVNASRNNVVIENLHKLSLEKAFAEADIILTGDVCYNQSMTSKIMRWLYYCVYAGVPVLLGDPARAYAPKTGIKQLAEYIIPVRRELEEAETRPAWVWRLFLPDDA